MANDREHPMKEALPRIMRREAERNEGAVPAGSSASKLQIRVDKRQSERPPTGGGPKPSRSGK